MIRNFILFWGILILVACKAAQPLTEEQKVISVVKEIPGKSETQLFDNTKIWIAQTFRSAKAVLEYENREQGVIIGNGISTYPCSGMSCLAKGDWKLHYTMKVEFKEGRYRVTFSNLETSWPGSYSSGIYSPAHRGPVSNQGDYEEIKATLLALADDLDNSLKNDELKAEDW